MYLTCNLWFSSLTNHWIAVIIGNADKFCEDPISIILPELVKTE